MRKVFNPKVGRVVLGVIVSVAALAVVVLTLVGLFVAITPEVRNLAIDYAQGQTDLR